MDNSLSNFEPVAKIVVIGVGGGGCNAVNRMVDEEISNVEFFVANTDKQALSLSKAPNRIVLGKELTKGLGAGGDPEVGRLAAEETVDEIKEIVAGADMVFVAAGMGGGTGTGAAPVIAKCAKDAGALTIGIVTRPFTFEGESKLKYSIDGLNNLKQSSDSIIVVSNDKLLMNNGSAKVSSAFSESDRILAQSVKTICDLILMPAIINRDFADVRNTLKDSGKALIGFGSGEGPNRSEDAALSALNCPLIEQSISGARRAICHITCGEEVELYECYNCVKKIKEESGSNMDLKFGVAINDQLSDQIMVSIIAGDFENDTDFENAEPLQDTQLDALIENHRQNEQNHVEDLNENANKNNEIDDIIPDFNKFINGD